MYASAIDNEDAFLHYCDKVKSFGFDPYLLDNFVINWSCINFKNINYVYDGPPIEKIDIHEYFIQRLSFLSYEAFKAEKSLLAYNYFVSGKVHNVRWIIYSNSFLIRSEVSFIKFLVSSHSLRKYFFDFDEYHFLL